MEIPRNCAECARTNSCRAPYYGGSRCEHAKEINRAAAAALLNKPKGGEKHG